MIITGLRAQRALATLATVGIALLTTGGALTPAAAAPSESVATAAREVTGLSVEIAGDVNASANAQAPYGIVVEAVSTLKDLSDVVVHLSVTDAPLTDADALREFTASPAEVAVHEVGATAFGAPDTSLAGKLVTGTRSTASVMVPIGGFSLPSDVPGVYGIVVTLTVAGETAWTRASPLTWQPSALPKLSVTPVVSVSGTEDRITALLAAAADPRVTLMVDPTALTFAQRQSLANRDAYALPAANIDITGVAHIATPALIDAALTRTRAYSSLPWIAVAATADDSTLNAATTAGAAAVLVDPRWSTLAAPVGGGAYDAGEVDGVATAPVIVADAALSSTLATMSPTDSTTTAWVLAQAAFEALSGAGSVVIAPGDGWTVSGPLPSRAIAVLLGAPFVTATPLSNVIASPARTAIDLPDLTTLLSDVPADQVAGAVSGLTRLGALGDATTGRSTMILDAERGLVESVSLANRTDPTFRTEQSTAALATANDVLSSVAVTSGSQVLLVSSSGSVPITVSNGLDVPVTVRVAVTSRSPILRTKEYPVATIEAGSDVTVKVPVTAVSSGDVSVSVALRTEAGATVAVAETLKVRVRAAWGNLATGVFTVGLVVLLIAGVFRTVRRGRKDTRLGPVDEAAVAGASNLDG